MGLAHQARVDPSACEQAIEILSSPDPDSRDLGDGRRIERVPGGFKVLNYLRVLEEGAREERRDYYREKKRESRARKKANGGTIRPEHVIKRRLEARDRARDAGDTSGVHIRAPGEENM